MRAVIARGIVFAVASLLAACQSSTSSTTSTAPITSAPAPSSTTSAVAIADPVDAAAGLDASAPIVSPAMGARLRARTNEVLAALKAKDMTALAALTHPTKGVRFSPYAFVDRSADVTLSRAQLVDAMSVSRVRKWGDEDGSGDPINLTFARYYKRFVWPHDFTTAPEVGIDHGESTGNTLDNIGEAYPDAHFVELFFPGFDPKFTGMDWASLRLVFEDARNDDGGTTLWLVGIIHGQWTI